MTPEPIFELPRHASTVPLVWGAVALVFLVVVALIAALREQKRLP
jgi:hypothetical protein